MHILVLIYKLCIFLGKGKPAITIMGPNHARHVVWTFDGKFFFLSFFFLTNIACLSSDLQTMHRFGKRVITIMGPNCLSLWWYVLFCFVFFLTNQCMHIIQALYGLCIVLGKGKLAITIMGPNDMLFEPSVVSFFSLFFFWLTSV